MADRLHLGPACLGSRVRIPPPPSFPLFHPFLGSPRQNTNKTSSNTHIIRVKTPKKAGLTWANFNPLLIHLWEESLLASHCIYSGVVFIVKSWNKKLQSLRAEIQAQIGLVRVRPLFAHDFSSKSVPEVICEISAAIENY